MYSKVPVMLAIKFFILPWTMMVSLGNQKLHLSALVQSQLVIYYLTSIYTK